MADLDRLARLSPEQRNRLQKRLASRAAAKLRASKEDGAVAAAALPEGVEPGEPIAVVGMACRFAGAPNVDAYWRMIRDGRSGVTEVPPERWPVDEFFDPAGGPGKSTTRHGAFVDGVDLFEPTFFGVTPREAARMDPQQRLLLEVAWETLENAGWPADRIAGSTTGVYVGIGGTDYGKAPIHSPEYFQLIDAHVGTGNALSIASNRVSYVLDLRGPSLSVDTACSSSSLAIHLAVQSLRKRESDAALAGGVNAILTPEVTIAFSQAHMLAPEGRCRSYDAGATGYVRGEGCAMVMLKRLEDAQRDGDDVLGVILGTAVNQDGRTPGIAAPSVVQQQACLYAAMADAGVTPDDIDYVEGHGTGTPLGDPIELQALSHVFRGTADDKQPLWVTSVKANIGHTETVSGAAGLIKTLLLLRHETIPPQLHLERLNPHAHLDGSRVEALTEPRDWARRPGADARRRVAGVSSFGFGGANTHLVVAEPEQPSEQVAAPTRPTQVIKLAGKTPDRVPEQASLLADWLRSGEGADADLEDVAFTANTGRCDFSHRVAVVASERGELLTELDRIAKGGEADAALDSRRAPRVAWLFTGQGAQRPGMGRELYEAEPIFRSIIDRCEAAVTEVLGHSLTEVMFAPTADEHGGVNRTLFTQPALYAFECAMAALWKSWGVTPNVLLGHSIGEYAAAVSAGVLSLEDGARLVAHRARLMDAAPGDGGMAVVFAAESDVAASINGSEDRLAIAAVNGPQNTVLSGDTVELEAALADLRERKIEAKRLTVSHAFHSPLMDGVLDEFEAIAREVEHAPPRVPIASNVTGRLLTADDPPADWPRYWRDQLRGAVRFADGVAACAGEGASHWIECGPASVLSGMAARCDADFAPGVRWVASTRPGEAETDGTARALATHWAGGGEVDWRGVYRDRRRRRLPLPNYPMKRERFWYENLELGQRSSGVAQAAKDGSPALGGALRVATPGEVFETPVDANTPGWIGDHQVHGSIVGPAAMFLEQALAAAAESPTSDGTPLRVEGLKITKPLIAPAKGRLRVQTCVDPESYGRRQVAIRSTSARESDSAWEDHATATISSTTVAAASKPQLEGFKERVVQHQSRAEFYKTIGDRGLEYGPAFRMLQEIQRTAYDAVAEVVPHRAVNADLRRYRLHPVLGDALLQTVACTLPLEADGSNSPHTYLPVEIGAAVLHRPVPDGEPLRAYAIRRSPGPESDEASPLEIEADAFLLGGDGQPIAELRGVRIRRLEENAAHSADGGAADWLYQIEWRPSPIAANESADGSLLLFADNGPVGDEIIAAAQREGRECVIVQPGERFATSIEENGTPRRTRITIDPNEQQDYDRLVEWTATADAAPFAGVLHAWSVGLGSGSDDWAGVEAVGAGSVMRLIKSLVRSVTPTPKLGIAIVTQQAVATADEAATAQQSATVGLVRSAAMEHPELRLRLIDLDGDATPATNAHCAVAEIAADTAEDQVAYRGEDRLVARLSRAADAAQGLAPQGTPPPSAPSWRLGLRRGGSFDALRYEPSERVPPGPGQVEMEIHATGLNFSDVLKALGLYPGIRDKVVPLGIEASGVVTAVGEGVEHVAVGDEAIGVAPYAFGSHATTAAYAVVRKPGGVSHGEGATVPIPFLTAHHALVSLAGLARGERVLIHAAAGGVGLAALQIAQHAGAEIFATAGSDEKRDLLRSLGVNHVMNSRTLEFAAQIREATDGEGVDVVLNSLPGEAIDASLGVLRAYGRFCEIGKIDIYQDRKIGLLPFQDNLSYFAIDLDRLLRERPERVQKLFAEVMERFDEGVYRPLPMTEFAVDRTAEAFRYMSARKNIGKVVVSMRPDEAADAPTDSGAWLITGGFGALGRQLARHLARRGVAGVVLMSRGAPDETFLDELRSAGVQPLAARGDVADASSLRDALGSIPADFPRITGVVHAAGVLDDGLVSDLDAERLRRVLRPKAVGAWNLHQETTSNDSPLRGVERFVLFSSAAATLGSPGQANYAAANAALDALAAQRRSLGLPAMSIAWGPWADASGGGAGMASGETAAAVEAKGTRLLPPGEALRVMDGLVNEGPASLAVIDAHWEAITKALSGRRPPLLEDLLTDGQAAPADASLRRRLLDAEPAERLEELVALVRGELARVTSVAIDEIAVDAPLTTIGIDSLMALELKNNLETKLAITLPMGKLLAGPSVTTLAQAAVEELLGESADEATAAWSPLVVLREGESGRTPLIVMPVLGGDVGAYRELADQLPAGRPVIAIRPRGLDTEEAPHERVDDAARDYAAAIQEAHPNGPYLIAGWSTGGITALAVAQRLEAAGQAVEAVWLLDTPPPSVYDRVDTNDDAAFLAAILDFAARFSGRDSGDIDAEALTGETDEERFASALAAAKRAGVMPEDVDEPYVRRLVAVGEALVVATRDFEPGPVRASVRFFSPQVEGGLGELTRESGKNVTTWRDVYGEQLVEHTTPGDHFTMMTGDGAHAIAKAVSD